MNQKAYRLPTTVRPLSYAVELAADPARPDFEGRVTVELDVDEKAGTALSRFAPTRPVSSYLAALTIGDLEGTHVREVHGIPLRVWAMRGKLDQTQFALDYTGRLLPWYETYFDVPYPFVKYDQ